METKLEGIAVKARKETNLRFTSLCHHITKELVWDSLCHIPTDSSPGVDGITVDKAKETFPNWIEVMLQSVHHKGYKAPLVRRIWIPKPGKKECKRPLAVPCVSDRALQRSVSKVLSAIYEQDFLPCSFGGRPNLSAHNALATFNSVVTAKKISWVYEADLKNFFGSLDKKWLIKFVEHRVGDPRIINMIQRWLKAGILEDGEVYLSKTGIPQGGSISVLLSNIYLHYVLDLWFEKVVKPKLRGEAYMQRYIDDFVVCFQYRSDAQNFQKALNERLGKFSLELEPTKTQLIKFGRFAWQGVKKMKTVSFLGFTHYCTINRKGNFMVGRKTEKTRFKRSVDKLYELMRKIRHFPVKEQIQKINQVLRGHYYYYGLGGNIKSLLRIKRITEKYWHRMLSSRSRKGYVTWEKLRKLKSLYPILSPFLSLPFKEMPAQTVL